MYNHQCHSFCKNKYLTGVMIVAASGNFIHWCQHGDRLIAQLPGFVFFYQLKKISFGEKIIMRLRFPLLNPRPYNECRLLASTLYLAPFYLIIYIHMPQCKQLTQCYAYAIACFLVSCFINPNLPHALCYAYAIACFDGIFCCFGCFHGMWICI